VLVRAAPKGEGASQEVVGARVCGTGAPAGSRHGDLGLRDERRPARGRRQGDWICRRYRHATDL